MTTKTPQQARHARENILGFTSTQMAEALGLANGSMVRRFEAGDVRMGRTTSFVYDILTGAIDPSDHKNEVFRDAVDKLDGPTRALICLITGDLDRRFHLAAIRAKRGRKKIQKDVD